MDATRVIYGAIAIVVGLVLLPLVGQFITVAKSDTDVTNVSGISAVLDLIMYGFAFGLVGLGVGMIAWGFKK